MLMKFAIDSLSAISTFVRACSAFAVIIWESVSCAWFAASPYPWSAAVAVLRIL